MYEDLTKFNNLQIFPRLFSVVNLYIKYYIYESYSLSIYMSLIKAFICTVCKKKIEFFVNVFVCCQCCEIVAIGDLL